MESRKKRKTRERLFGGKGIHGNVKLERSLQRRKDFSEGRL